MKRSLAIILILLIGLSMPMGPAILADNATKTYTDYMLEWREKSELAQTSLKEAEQNLKSGNRAKACINERIASEYGVQAFQSLKKAKQINANKSDYKSIEEQIEVWERIGECIPIPQFISFSEF